jgi:hypothetical protein
VRSTSTSRDDLPWIALVEELEAARALVEIDWKTDADDFVRALRKLRRGFSLPRDPGGYDERSTWELLEIAGARLRAERVRLAALDIGSDSYCLVIVPVGQVAELVKLAKRAKYGTIDLFGDDLAAATKDRIARVKRYEREDAREATRKTPPWTMYARGDETWNISVAVTAFNTSYRAPGVKRYVSRTFSRPRDTDPAARRQVAEWREAGFVKLTAAQARARTVDEESAFLGWIGPFPEDGRYFVEGEHVRWIAVRGDELVTIAGSLGKSFGEVESHYHGAKAAARSGYALEHFERSKAYEPITRAKLMQRYGRKAPPIDRR